MLTGLIIGFALILFFYFLNKKPSGIPPGIWGWPLFGSLPSKDVPLVEQVRHLSKKYGNTFSWRIGSNINIFLCDYEVIKSAFNDPHLSGRPRIYTIDIISKFEKLGLSNSSGKLWQDNRRFALRHLKDLGMGKRSLEEAISNEVSCLIDHIEKNIDGTAKPISWALNVAILNIIWRITADIRYDVDDPKINRFQEIMNELFREVPQLLAMYDLIPGLHKFVPEFFNKKFGVQDHKDIWDELRPFLYDAIADHQKTLNPAQPRDFIDHYLIEMEAQKNNPDSHMCTLDLMMNLADLFVAGSETTSTTLRWAIFYAAKYPNIQKKIHKELDAVVEREVLPSIEHRSRLPYLEAFTREVHRIVSLAGLALPHFALEQTTINGFTIPKGSTVVANVESCHMDPVYWKTPNEFNPDHFLDSEGKFIQNKEGFVPFSIGKRVCPGESLAHMELFLFLSGMLHNFTFSFPEGEDTHVQRNPKDRIMNTCKQYNVFINKRF